MTCASAALISVLRGNKGIGFNVAAGSVVLIVDPRAILALAALG